jgi:hypothetical protein
MPRKKGSKNKPRIYGGGIPLFLKELPKDLQKSAVDLSEETGISLKKILADAVAEGLAYLRQEDYRALIESNKRRGKVIHERDLVPVSVDPQTKQRIKNDESTRQTDSDEEGSPDTVPWEPPVSHSGVATESTGLFFGPVEERSGDAAIRSGFGAEDQESAGSPGEELG